MFCSNCGQSTIIQINPTVSKCQNCGYEFFGNPKATATAVIVCKDKLLLIERKHNPFAGSWAFVGGFLDYGENSKEAMIREIKEEIGLDISLESLVFLDNSTHDYTYQNQTISINTNAYLIQISKKIAQEIQVGDDASGYKWVNKNDVFNMDLPFSNNEIAQKAVQYLDDNLDLASLQSLELPQIRQLIDKTDAEILNLFAKRFELVGLVADYKKANNISAFQPNRWQEVLQNRQEIAISLGINPNFVVSVWEILHQEALRLENQILK